MSHHPLPFSLAQHDALKWCNALVQSPDDVLEVDCSELQHCEPFGMLLTASAARRAAAMGKQLLFSGIDLSPQRQNGHRYAESMGFWWVIGANTNRPSNLPQTTDRYVRIQRFSYADLFREAGGRDPVRAETVLALSHNLASNMTGSNDDTALYKALVYSLSEMMRNAFEHSGAPELWIAAASRRGNNHNAPDVQIAVLDEGRGIRASLAENPAYKTQADEDAILKAIEPGVSRNTGKKRSHAYTERLLEQFPGQDPTLYDNHGFGLAMVSSIARRAGKFALISGSSAVTFHGNATQRSDANHKGTAVHISIQPERLGGVIENVLAEHQAYAKRTGAPNAVISASMMKRLGY